MSRPHGVHLFRLRLVEDTSWCLVGHPTNLPKSGNLFRVRLCLGDQTNHMVCIHILTQKHCVNILCVKSGKWHNYFLPLEKANIILNGKSGKLFFFIYREFFCYECRLLCRMLLVWPNKYQDTYISFFKDIGRDSGQQKGWMRCEISLVAHPFLLWKGKESRQL